MGEIINLFCILFLNQKLNILNYKKVKFITYIFFKNYYTTNFYTKKIFFVFFKFNIYQLNSSKNIFSNLFLQKHFFSFVNQKFLTTKEKKLFFSSFLYGFTKKIEKIECAILKLKEILCFCLAMKFFLLT